MKNKWVRIASAVAGAVLLAIIIRCGFVAIRYHAVAGSGSANWLITKQPFYSSAHSMEFLVDSDAAMALTLWWDGVTGSVDVTIVDDKGTERFHEKADRIDQAYSIPLDEGKYELQLDIFRFSGAIAIGYDDIVITRDLPDDRYALMPADPAEGFYWEYLLYIPYEITHKNLLVVPNNTGYPTDNMDIHREEAKKLILEKSGMADELGVPLLVPVFPRTEDMYTHALDRATMLTDIEELTRIDLQMIAMIEDAKGILRGKGIAPEDRILMSGFSASADFTDRFTILHPGIVKAASIGGASILPWAALRGENLPYPLGIYGYEAITGKPFDMDAFAAVYRYLYKGSADENGWVTIEENGKTRKYTGKEYYEQYQLPEIEEALRGRPSPLYTGGDLTDIGEKEIAYRVYDGKILVDQFLKIQSIFSEMGLDRNEFAVYEGVEHSVTEEMAADELRFFRRVLDSE